MDSIIYRFIKPLFLGLVIFSITGCVSYQWKNSNCVPPFELVSEPPIKMYFEDWVDRSYRYSSVKLAKDDLFLCLQVSNPKYTWCEDNTSYDINNNNKLYLVASPLEDNQVVKFTGTVLRNHAPMDPLGAHSTYFEGFAGEKKVWLSAHDLLYLGREEPEALKGYEHQLAQISYFEMLELYLSHDRSSSKWKCTER